MASMAARLARSLFVAALVLAPAACGKLPQPLAGHPGAVGRLLAEPPPARLAVPPPPAGVLPAAAATALAQTLAQTLQAQEVPAVAEPARRGDWRLITTPDLRGNQVVVVFSVRNPAGEDQGTTESAPIPAAAWAEGNVPTVQALAVQAAPAVGALLTRIEAARRKSDPASLINRPARVYFAGVHGAPGDGDQSLTRQMRVQLPQLGPTLQDTPAGADYTLEAKVTLSPLAGGMQQIEVAWRVTDAQGRECGKATQLKEIPAGSLDGLWGDVAAVAVQEAAGGVQDIITNYSGVRAAGGAPPNPDRGGAQKRSEMQP